MRLLTLVALLSTTGLIACSQDPTSPKRSVSRGATAAADTASECVQTGDNSGQCGSQAADSTATDSTETNGSEG